MALAHTRLHRYRTCDVTISSHRPEPGARWQLEVTVRSENGALLLRREHKGPGYVSLTRADNAGVKLAERFVDEHLGER